MTEEKKAFEEANTLADLVREATDSIIFTDLDGNIKYVNPSFERITGYRFEEVEGKNPRILRSKNSPHTKRYFRKMWKTLLEGGVWHGEFVNTKKNGQDYIEEVSIFPVKDRRTEAVIGYGAVKKDITRQRELEDILRKSFEEVILLKEKAELANRLKSLFLANMSHDIRTPLNAIMGFTDLLLKTERRDNPRNYLTKIKDSSQILLALIDDILDFSKIEAGQLDIDKHTFSVRDLLDSINSIFEIQFRQKQIHFEIVMNESLPIAIFNDKWRITQILTNLLSNALKFTAKGKVMAKASYRKKSDTLLLEISDTGIGIAPQNLEHIFDPFYQVQNQDNLERKGTGLGLAICKKLVHLMGGHIHVTSTLGEGTRFEIDLPANTGMIAKTPPPKKSEPVPALSPERTIDLKNKTGNTILIVEDNPVNRELITEQFNEAGFYSILLAKNGKVAVEMALQHHPDLVLMDIQMPVMDGNQAIMEMKKKGYNGPIIILSAYAMREDIDKSIQSGAVGYITKPIDFGTFFNKIAPFLKDKSTSSAPQKLKYPNPRISPQTDLTLKGSASLRIKNIFLNDVKKRLEIIDQVLESNTFEAEQETIRTIAHSYRGNAGYFDLKPLESVALQLETAIRDEKKLEEQMNLTRILAGILERIVLENKLD